MDRTEIVYKYWVDQKGSSKEQIDNGFAPRMEAYLTLIIRDQIKKVLGREKIN